MSYKINLGQWNGIFAVPSSVVDKHIKLASETQLKVLLYLLRHCGREVSADELSQALKISAEEAENAVSFWIERDLLAEIRSELVPSESAGEPSAAAEAQPIAEETKKKPHTAPSRAQRPDSAFVAKLLKENTYLTGFLEEAQRLLKKPLSSGDTQILIMLYDSFGLPCEVIVMLIDHLASTGEANMRSIEKLGIRWADEGINTVEAAEREIERLQSSRDAWGRVSSLLGIRNVGRPTKAQMDSAYRWLYTWGFNDEMILEAYERCVNTKGVYNMSYINAILKKWHDKDIKSLDRLKEDEAVSKKKQGKNKRASDKGSVFSLEGASFDITKFENDSLFDD